MNAVAGTALSRSLVAQAQVPTCLAALHRLAESRATSQAAKELVAEARRAHQLYAQFVSRDVIQTLTRAAHPMMRAASFMNRKLADLQLLDAALQLAAGGEQQQQSQSQQLSTRIDSAAQVCIKRNLLGSFLNSGWLGMTNCKSKLVKCLHFTNNSFPF